MPKSEICFHLIESLKVLLTQQRKDSGLNNVILAEISKRGLSGKMKACWKNIQNISMPETVPNQLALCQKSGSCMVTWTIPHSHIATTTKIENRENFTSVSNPKFCYSKVTQRGVRQGDPFSPKPFTTPMEEVFKKADSPKESMLMEQRKNKTNGKTLKTVWTQKVWKLA